MSILQRRTEVRPTRNTMKNNRTFLDKLLDGAEVKWKPLSLVTEMQRGKTITAKSANEGSIPVISGGQKPAYYHNESNRDGKTITVAGSGAYAGYIMYWEEPIFVSDAFSIKTDESLLQIKYVYHFLLQNQQKIYAMKKGSGVPHVYPKDIGVLLIPIPSPTVQTEIVRILDALTALTSELTSELILRQKQYEYYREKLLSFDSLERLNEGGAKKKLIDVCINIFSGKNKERNDNGLYPIYGSTGIIGKTNNKEFSNEQILVARVGANAGYVHIAKGEYDVSDNTLIVQNNEQVHTKFLYHILVNMKLNQYAKGAGQPLITAGQLKSMEIFIPLLEEQHRIVSILDKFETLTNSITEGLPLAIEQSQKRYEYYRELLLSFPKLDN
nr:restriction endonuclease subunit S [Aggregatibacter actinomycetemcomitans]